MGLLPDVRYAVRALTKSPSFSMAAVFTLALGIAANTIAFTLLNALVLRPMPVPAAHRVVRVFPIDATGRRHNLFSSADARDYRAQATGFDVLAAYIPSDVTIGRSSRDTADVAPRPAVAYVVSQGYFDLVGFRPALGRLLEAADERARIRPGGRHQLRHVEGEICLRSRHPRRDDRGQRPSVHDRWCRAVNVCRHRAARAGPVGYLLPLSPWLPPAREASRIAISSGCSSSDGFRAASPAARPRTASA